MSHDADLLPVKINHPVIKILLSRTEIQLHICFSNSCCETMFAQYEQGMDYRSAFTIAVFRMYKQTTEKNRNTLTEKDFIKLEDKTLHTIIAEILKQDNKLQSEFNKVQVEDIYEKFYKANEVTFKYASIYLEVTKAFEEASKILYLLRKPLLSSLSNTLNNLGIPKTPQIKIAKPANFLQLQTALEKAQKIQSSQISSIIANVPFPKFDIQDIISPLNCLVNNIEHINIDLAQTLQNSIRQIEEPIRALITSIDFSLLTYRREWSEGRETLLNYGWFYSSELPEEVVNKIHQNRDVLSTVDVDNIIVEYFRSNRCESLKKIVHGWNKLPYFACRKIVFHEALVNHSRRYFNASVTLLTIHTEGIVRDFVKNSLQSPRFYMKKAITDVKEALEQNTEMSICDYEVFNDVIEKIEKVFNESFDCANPEKTSNDSRHKISHGHAYGKETEVNSLKHFLYLNEIYHLFTLLSASHNEDQNI